MARPRAGDWLDDEVENWRAVGVEVVVSLLEPEEEAELGLQSEEHVCRAKGIEFMRFAIPDRGVPKDAGEAWRLACALGSSGKAIAIHCRAGIGRSSLMAALVLLDRGVAPDLAFELLRAARGVPVPDTDQQREWVEARWPG